MSRFIFTDLHGNRYLWNKIKNLIKPKDELFFLGDAADRGEEGWVIIKEILAHPQITYIKGNHEYMLEQAMDEYLRNDGIRGMKWDLLVYNGGYQTFEDWVDEGAKPEWLYMLRKLPCMATINLADGTPVHLTHAGFSSNKPTPEPYILMWDRKHMLDEYEDDSCLIIHGHTPIRSIKTAKAKPFEPFPYTNKIDIDFGTFNSSCACLLNVDTMEYALISELEE